MRVNIAEAKAKFSALLRAAQAGEPVIICERNREIAEIRALPAPRTSRRPAGPARPGFAIPDAFFDPLPEELQRAFEGRHP